MLKNNIFSQKLKKMKARQFNMLNNKVDFIVTIEVEQANPNGDPLAGNMPRTDSGNYGLISDVAIKRKIRNRMQDLGHDIFVKSRERSDDGFTSLQQRYSSVFAAKDEEDKIIKEANERWLDVRSFGQVITYHKKSIGIRGPVSIRMSKSLEPVEITSMQITRSVNGMDPSINKTKSSDTMGTKHYVEYGVYVIYGAVNVNFSEKTGFNEKDLEIIKRSLLSLFENDASSARPEGSIAVKEVFWFTHSNKLGNVSTSKIHSLFEWDVPIVDNIKYEDYNIRLNEEKVAAYKKQGLKIEEIEVD